MISNEITVFTVAFGRDFVPAYPFTGVDPKGRKVKYVCFSDHAAGAERGWEIRPPVKFYPENPSRSSRYHKINCGGFFDSEFSLYMDTRRQLRVNPWTIVDRVLPTGLDFATFRHPTRTTVYDELLSCIMRQKDDAQVMARQVLGYRQCGFPDQSGLFKNCCLLRRSHAPAVFKLNASWWNQIERGSWRDQLSLPFVIWNQKLESHLAALPDEAPPAGFFDEIVPKEAPR